MTQIEQARKNEITSEMEKVSLEENLPIEYIKDKIAKGQIVLLKNKIHNLSKIVAVGKGLKTKINANIGTSSDKIDLDFEIEKLKTSIKYGADTIMDLSTGGDLDNIRKEIIKNSSIPIGTVPIYQAAVEAKNKTGSIMGMTKQDIFNIIEKHFQDGIDFITIHSGLMKETLKRLKRSPRVVGIVSRGGAFLSKWMLYHSKENPLYEYYDELLDLAYKYDVVLSLGDALRPGSIVDATDTAQVQELIILGELAQRSWDKNVSVIIEGPGHMPIDQIRANVLLEKKLCNEAPFYILGPLTTDIAPGYDHITSAIGGAIAGAAGADFLCYVTPAEHLKLPDINDVKEGVIAAKIAAHSADLSKKVKGAFEQDKEMSLKRKSFDWDGQMKIAIDPEKIQNVKEESKFNSKVCTMCGEFCSMKDDEELFCSKI